MDYVERLRIAFNESRFLDEAGCEKFDGDLLGVEPKTSFAAIVAAACAAATELDDPGRVVHCSFGDFSAREYFWQINSFRGLRAHDLALVIESNRGCPTSSCRGIWDEISPHVEEWRAIGVFPAAVPVPESAPLRDRLLGITGRPPR